MKSFLKIASLVGLLLAFDQLTKAFSERFLGFYEPSTIIPHLLTFQLVHNYGAAYGIFHNQRLFLAGFGVLVFCICAFGWRYWATSRASYIGLVALMAGTLGNTLDRLFRGYVVDFIYLNPFPFFNVFNVADVLIDIGILAFLIDFVLSSSAKKSS